MTDNDIPVARKKTASPTGARKRKRARSGDEELQARVSTLLDAFEQQIKDQTLKVSVADYIRLLQLRREFEEQKPKDIEVTWVDSLKEKKDTGT